LSVTATPLFNALFAPSSQGTVYTSPSQVTTIIDKFTATNVTGSNANLTVNIVASGSSVTTSNTIVGSLSVLAHTQVDLSPYLQHVLGPADFISVLAGTANAIVIMGSGRQVQ
jgi:hypothetical protein